MATKKIIPVQLPEEVSKSFKCTTEHPKHDWHGTRVDLRTVSIDKAKVLVKAGFPFLEEVKPVKESNSKD